MSFAKKASILGITAALLSATGVAVLAQGAPTLNGAGATFPAPFYQSAFAGLASSEIGRAHV